MLSVAFATPLEIPSPCSTHHRPPYSVGCVWPCCCGSASRLLPSGGVTWSVWARSLLRRDCPTDGFQGESRSTKSDQSLRSFPLARPRLYAEQARYGRARGGFRPRRPRAPPAVERCPPSWAAAPRHRPPLGDCPCLRSAPGSPSWTVAPSGLSAFACGVWCRSAVISIFSQWHLSAIAGARRQWGEVAVVCLLTINSTSPEHFSPVMTGVPESAGRPAPRLPAVRRHPLPRSSTRPLKGARGPL
jgi:hypothetical protein